MKYSKLEIIALLALFMSADFSTAILNGQIWQVAPYMARIVYANAQGQGGQAGGTIISSRHVLTTGFVLTPDFVNLQVWVGGVTRANQQFVAIQPNPSRILHPSYQASPRLNDIGIIFLATDLIFNRFVQSVALPALPAPGQLSQVPYLNIQGTALGFGAPQQENLQAAFLRVVTAERCNGQYPSHNFQNQFCAEDARLRSDICSNDIGGGFITLERNTEVLTGISSVPICNQNQPPQPSLFTRVSSYRTFINENTGV